MLGNIIKLIMERCQLITIFIKYQFTFSITYYIFIILYILISQYLFLYMDPNDKGVNGKKKYFKKSQLVKSPFLPEPKLTSLASEKQVQDNQVSAQNSKPKPQVPLLQEPVSSNQKMIEGIDLERQKQQRNVQDKKTLEPLLFSVKDKINQQNAKKLKQRFLQTCPNAEKIILRYEEGRPRIYFFYQIGNKEKRKQLTQIIKANQMLRKNRQLIQRCYDDLFRRVEQKFLRIGHFGIKVAEKNKIRFHTKIFTEKTSKEITQQYLLYYETQLQKINFIMFDSQLNYVEFSTQNIMTNREQNIQQYQLYKQFQKYTLNNQQNALNQYIGQQERDSDQQERKQKILKRKQMKNDEMKVKIERMINREIEPFQESIERKNQQVLKLNKNNENNKESITKLENLSDQIMEEQASLDNFTQTRDDVISKMEKKMNTLQQETQMLKACLKRMILAEKQLISRLPIISRKREIFEKLDKNNLLILEGETGSGKSTQLPQLLCEYYRVFEREDALPVLITQPRKLATRTLAERVASEMEETVHGFVDYQTSLTSKVNEKAKIVFKMDRLVLDELKIDPKLSKYCCLVIDEAHERTISIDVILGLIKNLLTLRKDFKIIVTSASMDTELFRRYFKTEILKVSGRMHPVQEIFQPYGEDQNKTRKIIKLINEKLLEQNGKNLRQQYKGHILVFCSGIDQIDELCQQYRKLDEKTFKVLALHGKLTSDEQRYVFMDTKQHKIIFSTRIAETSITIDKIKVVIDPGEDRQLIYDQKNRITTFQLTNISISSANQRAGRAGRTNSGYCFRLYSERDKKQFSLNKTPQIQNMALDTVVLRLKSLDIEDVVNFPYISPPIKQNILNSVQLMKLLSCLDKNGKITEVGQFLVKIPIQPFLARAIIEAMMFEKVKISQDFKNEAENIKMKPFLFKQLIERQILEEVIIVLCMVLNASNLFVVNPKQRQKLDKMKFQKYKNEQGDFFFFIKIYRQYEQHSKDRQNRKALNSWAKQHYLSLKVLSQTRELINEIKQIIRHFEINQKALKKQMKDAKRKLKTVSKSNEAVFSCLLTSFINNLALYSGHELVGYTVISNQIPIQIYGSSILTIQGVNPKWIIFFDIYQSQKGEMFCKVANPVQFEFLIKNTDPCIVEKTNIAKADKLNPYYLRYQRKCPSLISMQIMADYQARFSEDRPDLQFLRNSTMIFHENTGKIESYFLKRVSLQKQADDEKYKKMEEQEERNIIQQLVAYYLKFEEKYNNSLQYNYIGYFYVRLKDGFEITHLENKSIQYQFNIMCQEAERLLILSYGMHSFYGIIQCGVLAIVDEINVTEFEQLLKGFGNKIKYVSQKINRIDKLPQAKIFVHFWTGEIKKQSNIEGRWNVNNIFLTYRYYKKSKNNQKDVDLQHILSCFNQKGLSQLPYQNKLLLCVFQISQKQTGINVFFRDRSNAMDQIQLLQIISDYHKRGLFGSQFVMPKFIKKFRDPQFTLSIKSQEQWEQKINILLKDFGFQDKTYQIRCWGVNFYNKRQISSELQQLIKVQWHAQIKSTNIKLLQQFRNEYDKKIGILGTEKAHFKFQFQTIIAKVDYHAFQWLKQQYEILVEELKNKNPRVLVQCEYKKLRELLYVIVKARSQFRDQIIEISQELIKLLTPKQIVLPNLKFKFLFDDRDRKILTSIQEKIKQKVSFGFDKKQSKLKIYCKDEHLKDILQMLSKKINEYKLHERSVSFRGKNLKLIEWKIKEKIKKIAQQEQTERSLSYQILFQKRSIRLIGDVKSCTQMENQITHVVSQAANKCEICNNLIEKPYWLFNCIHRFCWNCLSDYIKQSITSKIVEPLKCPECKECKHDINLNVYDIQRIISEDQFNKLCDLRVTHYLQNQSRFIRCLTENCQNIQEKQKIQKVGHYQCEICGKWHCLKCGQSHKNFTCEEKRRQDQDRQKAEREKILCINCKQNVGEKCTNCWQYICAECKKKKGRICLCYRYF